MYCTCRMSLALYMVIMDLGAAGIMMIGVREGRFPEEPPPAGDCAPVPGLLGLAPPGPPAILGFCPAACSAAAPIALFLAACSAKKVDLEIEKKLVLWTCGKLNWPPDL